jgi:hypothetical protein
MTHAGRAGVAPHALRRSFAGVVAIRENGRRNDFAVDDTQDAAAFTTADLARHHDGPATPAPQDVVT